MPRKADVRLEGRILDAAYRLWSTRGEHALTMRAVACAAGTTTPTLYERFHDKGDLLALLRRRARQNLFASIRGAHSPLEACDRALDFFVAHPNEFALITEDWAISFARKESMPSFDFLKRRLAGELGGRPDDHLQIALAMVALLHGTANFLHSEDVHAKIHRDFRHSCMAACEALLQHAAANGNGSSSRNSATSAGRPQRRSVSRRSR